MESQARKNFKAQNVGKLLYFFIVECSNATEKFILTGFLDRPADFEFKTKPAMPYDYRVIKKISGEPAKVYDIQFTHNSEYKGFTYTPKLSMKNSETYKAYIFPIDGLADKVKMLQQG